MSNLTWWHYQTVYVHPNSLWLHNTTLSHFSDHLGLFLVHCLVIYSLFSLCTAQVIRYHVLKAHYYFRKTDFRTWNRRTENTNHLLRILQPCYYWIQSFIFQNSINFPSNRKICHLQNTRQNYSQTWSHKSLYFGSWWIGRLPHMQCCFEIYTHLFS